MMTIDDAINHCLELAEQEECFINYPHSDIVLGDLDIESRKYYVAEQRQLAEWLTEYKEAKILLKSAIDNARRIDVNGDIYYDWVGADEALKLIGDEYSEH